MLRLEMDEHQIVLKFKDLSTDKVRHITEAKSLAKDIIEFVDGLKKKKSRPNA